MHLNIYPANNNKKQRESIGLTYLRVIKLILVAQVGLFAFLVALNNVFDYDSNFNFVMHVMSMDTTFENNKLLWRAVTHQSVHHFAYWCIIFAEAITGILCFVGTYQLWLHRHSSKREFQRAKKLASIGLSLGITLWFTGFMTVGAEWFLMWQSDIWNGQDAAFKFIVFIFLVLLMLHMPETNDEAG